MTWLMTVEITGKEAVYPLQSVLERRGYKSNVLGVVFSCNGQHIVSGAHDKTVRVWDTQTAKELRCLHGHEGEVRSVAYAPGGRRVVSGGGFEDHTVRVWDTES